MKKAIMLSIQPKWCELIASGKKTIEVRKTAPKLETPFKCYIYCTNKRPFLVWGDVFRGNWETEFTHLSGYGRKYAEKIWDIFNGKVLGEFVCDRIETIACHKYHNGVGFDYSYYTESNDTLMGVAQLSDYDLKQYLGVAEDGEVVGYGWHIFDLKVYDEPKEPWEFSREIGRDKNVVAYSKIIRPPQSWCYVEEAKNADA